MSTPRRDRVDACPGALTTHHAADGELARVRLPAGRVSARQLGALGECAAEHGDGMVHLTSRGNVQLRGLRSGAESALAATLADAGLLPAPAHERVRNYVASPASGHSGGLFDVRHLITELDTAVCARPTLTQLPGRFLFGLDDGRGDVAGFGADVCWQALDTAGQQGALLAGGMDTGLRVSSTDSVPALVSAASEFLRRRGDCWRVRELPAAVGYLRDAIVRDVTTVSRTHPSRPVTTEQTGGVRLDHTAVGTFTQDDGESCCVVAAPFGELSQDRIGALVEESAELVVTPWRTIMLPNISRSAIHGVLRRLADVGLATDSSAGWLRVSACIGMRGCAKANADVRADAAEVMRSLPTGPRLHFAGCERRCGSPGEEHVDVLATGHGYRVDGTATPAERLTESLLLSGTEAAQREGQQ